MIKVLLTALEVEVLLKALAAYFESYKVYPPKNLGELIAVIAVMEPAKKLVRKLTEAKEGEFIFDAVEEGLLFNAVSVFDEVLFQSRGKKGLSEGAQALVARFAPAMGPLMEKFSTAERMAV